LLLQYAVRGELFLKAGELQAAGKEIIFTNGELSLLQGVRGQHNFVNPWMLEKLTHSLTTLSPAHCVLQSATHTSLEPSR
jgi:hypothetical protein